MIAMGLLIDLVADLQNTIKKISIRRVLLCSNQGVIWVWFSLLLRVFFKVLTSQSNLFIHDAAIKWLLSKTSMLSVFNLNVSLVSLVFN